METSLTLLERVQKDSLRVVSDSEEVVENSVLDSIIRSTAQEIQILYPKSEYFVNHGITVRWHISEIVSFFCGIITADSDNFNIAVEDGTIHLRTSRTIVKGTEMFIWLRLHRVIQQYRQLMENPFLAVSQEMLIDLTSY